jgi:hypothetical protein
MKKILFVVAFVCAANFVSAQDAKADVKKLIQLTGANLRWTWLKSR